MIFLTSYDRELNILELRGALMRVHPPFAISRGISSVLVGFIDFWITIM